MRRGRRTGGSEKDGVHTATGRRMAIIFVLMGENGRLCQEHVHFDVETGSTMMDSFVVADPPIVDFFVVVFLFSMVMQRPSTLAIPTVASFEISQSKCLGNSRGRFRIDRPGEVASRGERNPSKSRPQAVGGHGLKESEGEKGSRPRDAVNLDKDPKQGENGIDRLLSRWPNAGEQGKKGFAEGCEVKESVACLWFLLLR